MKIKSNLLFFCAYFFSGSHCIFAADKVKNNLQKKDTNISFESIVVGNKKTNQKKIYLDLKNDLHIKSFGPINVKIKESNQTFITIDAEENILPHLIAEHDKNKTLLMGFKGGLDNNLLCGQVSKCSTVCVGKQEGVHVILNNKKYVIHSPIKYTIGLPALHSLHVDKGLAVVLERYHKIKNS